MQRRNFLKTAGLTGVALGLSPLGALAAAGDPPLPFDPTPANGWRTFEVTTRIELLKPAGPAQAWLPLPAVDQAGWTRTLGDQWTSNADQVERVMDPVYGAGFLHARWAAGAAPELEVVSRITTRDRAVDFSRPGAVAPLSKAERSLWTRPTEMLPTDGIVRKTALDATRGAATDLEKARALYDWVVDHTFRDPKTRGCGVGDIKAMLETGNLSGKCADLNALYVGLARAVGLPARDVYGIRVADSRYGYRSLGKSGTISKAQHCRAEVWLAGFGWVPVDPADVRKVILEEPPGNLARDDYKVRMAEGRLFGAWEMNWMAYNFGHDLSLPGSAGGKIPFLMYPQGETAAGRQDSLDPDSFKYTITSREVTA
ncbi:MAG: transglutaminase domain-containing protein [Rhodocyclaceae bacterium]|jgi:transglutaminase-like putative cysteine protease|nr:transglutaminase domain-containing protein [Rhodocyclaceae bacterium]